MSLEQEMSNEKSGILAPYSQPKSSITKKGFGDPNNKILDAIAQSIATQVGKDTKIDPLLIQQRQRIIEQDIYILKEQQNIKIRNIRELFKITASIGSVAIGLYLITISPLVSPLLITLGIAGALNYKLADVAELALKINNPQTINEIDKGDQNQDNDQNQDKYLN